MSAVQQPIVTHKSVVVNREKVTSPPDAENTTWCAGCGEDFTPNEEYDGIMIQFYDGSEPGQEGFYRIFYNIHRKNVCLGNLFADIVFPSLDT